MFVIAYDIGTTGLKSCLFEIGETKKSLNLIADEYQGYDLKVFPDGGAEQDTQQWWDAMTSTTKGLIAKSGVKPQNIAGLSFCSQMQGLVLVDKNLEPVRPPMSYMDQRAVKVKHDIGEKGLSVAGLNIVKLLTTLSLTKAAPTSVKDPLWKYKWVEKNETDNFSRVYKWLDVKEYFIARCTGECVMTRDSAYSTFLYDTRKGHNEFSKKLCKMYGVKKEHLPKVINCTDVVASLTEKAAKELGLVAGIPVYGGGGDATLIGLGAGSTSVGETHIYSGTSGWVETVCDVQHVDINAMIAGIIGAENGRYNYFAEMETAGKCFEWVKDHLALDEVNVYLHKTDVAQSQETEYESLYDYLSDVVSEVPVGSDGVIFTPWLHGNRCPFEDPNASGMFFNITLNTGKRELIRAVLEGICFHLRWMLESEDKKIRTSNTIRFVGGGALSKVTCQMLADITGRTIETVKDTKNVGAVGAAALVGIGQGIIPSFEDVSSFVEIADTYKPNEANKEIYNRNYNVFKKLYACNKKNFKALH